MVFTGIGSRNISKEETEFIHYVARKLYLYKYTLRSGGANGSDRAFESQFKKKHMKEIYLPWQGFNNSTSDLYDLPNLAMASKIASEFHPMWDNLKESVKHLHTRNVYQVLGKDLESPSEFIIFCADEDVDGNVSGGTGQAIRIADWYGIPRFNIRTQPNEVRKVIYHAYKRFANQCMKQIFLFKGEIAQEELEVIELLADSNWKEYDDDDIKLLGYFIRKYDMIRFQ